MKQTVNFLFSVQDSSKVTHHCFSHQGQSIRRLGRGQAQRAPAQALIAFTISSSLKSY